MGVRLRPGKRPVLTEEMPGPPEWVQEWYCPPPPDHAWFRVTRDDWVQTGDKYTRRVFAWTTAITVLTVRGEFTLEVVPSWS